MSLIGAQWKVDRFHEAADVPDDPSGREKYIREEAMEVIKALRSGDRKAIAHELADLVYVALGTAIACNIDLGPVFDEIHAANMRKVGPNGEVFRREDGKILKPPGWKPADVASVLQPWRGPCPCGDYDRPGHPWGRCK